MTNEPDGCGVFLKVYEVGGDFSTVVADDEGSIDAAVEQWLSSRETHDTLLHLTLVDGDTYRVRASRITGWLKSTPEGRRRITDFSKALDDENKFNRREAGFIEDQ